MGCRHLAFAAIKIMIYIYYRPMYVAQLFFLLAKRSIRRAGYKREAPSGRLDMLLKYIQREEKKKKKEEAYNTYCSQAVTHPGTEQARRCLTSVIRREPVCSAWYGRRH